jgi:Leucine-rich repeat (LRR) protein
VTYSNVFIAATIASPFHPVWQWLAKRSGRIADLTLELWLNILDASTPQTAGLITAWEQPLQTLSGIPGAQLRVRVVGRVADLNHPYIDQWLKQHGQLISRLTAEVRVSDDRLKLRDFAEAAVLCKSIDLRVSHPQNQVVDLSDLNPVAGSLQYFSCHSSTFWHGSLKGASAFKSMSQLTALHFNNEDLGNEEPWESLAKLTSLQRLSLFVGASGDPSHLSALTGLTSLELCSREVEPNDPVPFTFSSLQPLSTLQQLKKLYLGHQACTATSLQGLSGLSKLTLLLFEFPEYGGRLRSLEGIGPWVEDFSASYAPDLVSLAGIEGCTSMKNLTLDKCGVSSWKPLGCLSSLKQLEVSRCCVTSLEGLPSMSLESLRLRFCSSLTQLSGVEHLSALTSLKLNQCDVTSLQPLSQLRHGLQELKVYSCDAVQEEVLELPHVQPTADVHVVYSNVKRVVLALGVTIQCYV